MYAEMDPDKIIKQIREYTQPIYQLGEKNEDGISKVTNNQIKSKFKGKPDQAADVILNSLGIFRDVISTISLYNEQLEAFDALKAEHEALKTKVIKDMDSVLQEIRNDITKPTTQGSSDTSRTIQKLKMENEVLRKEKCASDIAETTGKKILQYVSENINENSKSLSISTKKLKSYADVLESKQSDIANNTSVTSIKTIKSTIKNVIRENKFREDRSKNVIIFGVEEMYDEKDLPNHVEQVESVMNTIEGRSECEHRIFVHHVARIGEKSPGKTRPIRVTLTEKYMVHDTLKYCKMLRGTKKYKNVYISMDRSPEQQKVHKELITRLKQSMRNHPDKYWYITNGSICSRQIDKPESTPITDETPKEPTADTTNLEVEHSKRLFQSRSS